jgi:colanic acid/amylovoran biosynthesis glycosyltransferase
MTFLCTEMQLSDDTCRKGVIIFRSNLFTPSEPFIVEQAEMLRRFVPILLGRRGAPPAGVMTETRTLDRYRSFANLIYGLQLATGSVHYYKKILEDHLPKASIVHAHFGAEATSIFPLARSLNIPLITTFHGYDATLSRWALLASRKPTLMSYAARRGKLAKRGELFLCVSNFIREKVVSLGFPPSKTITHYIGVDVERLRPLDFRPNPKMILHVARLVDVKGTADLIRALPIISDQHPDARLVIIGDGPLKRSLEAMAQNLGQTDRITFLGAQPHSEVIQWMQRAGIFCLPSRRAANGQEEAFGLVLVEAAACGVPVVTTRSGGIAEAMIHGVTGLAVTPRDPDQLASAIIRLLDAPDMAQGMGDAGRRHTIRFFNLRHQTKLLEETYQDVIDRYDHSADTSQHYSRTPL